MDGANQELTLLIKKLPGLPVELETPVRTPVVIGIDPPPVPHHKGITPGQTKAMTEAPVHQGRAGADRQDSHAHNSVKFATSACGP